MRILRYNDLVERGICRSRMTLHRIRKERGFPAAVDPGGGVGWLEDEVNNWISSRPRRGSGETTSSKLEAGV